MYVLNPRLAKSVNVRILHTSTVLVVLLLIIWRHRPVNPEIKATVINDKLI